MSSPTWLSAGWLQRHQTSPEEIRDLWLIAERDPKESSSGSISHDWEYGIAYNAALKLCTILLYAEGYKSVKGSLAHFRVLSAFPHILGAERQGDADYLDGCRQKRNTIEYDYVGGASTGDVEEPIAFGRELQAEVGAWLRENPPDSRAGERRLMSLVRHLENGRILSAVKTATHLRSCRKDKM